MLLRLKTAHDTAVALVDKLLHIALLCCGGTGKRQAAVVGVFQRKLQLDFNASAVCGRFK